MDYRSALLATILYADLFDFPLTVQELRTHLIGLRCSHQTLVDILKDMSEVESLSSFVFLSGRKSIVQKRIHRIKTSEQKLSHARSLTRLFSLIPSISLLAVSGSVGAQNATQAHDIDLFVITRPNTLYITRFLLLVLLEVFGLRGRFGRGREVYCVNFLLDEKHFGLPQDIYTAYELLHMIPIVERDATYTRLLQKNSWVKSILPQFHMQAPTSTQKSGKIGLIFFRILDPLVRFPQLAKLKRKRNEYEAEKGVLKLYKKGQREKLMRLFEAKLTRYHLDKVL